MKPRFKDYFHFNKSERRGTITLIVLIIVVMAIKQSLIYFNPKPEYNGLNLDSLGKVLAEQQRDNIDFSLPEDENIDTISYFEFDPNQLSVNKWQQLGLSLKQAEAIKNYENAGGEFRVKADVQKMYTISEEHYQQLKPFILLPDSLPKNEYSYKSERKKRQWENKSWKKEKRVYPKILINTADTAEFKKLYGIGDYYAQKIVEHRDALGGFITKDQLNEIWGLKPETLLKLDTQLVLNKISIRKININTASVEELKSHPYIYWKVANSIVKYREQHGKYKNLNQIKQSALISDSLFLKITPYLKY